MLHTVLGPVAPAAVSAVLPAEAPLRTSRPGARQHDQVATRVAYQRAPVDMQDLGKLALGWANHDNETLTVADAAQGLRLCETADDPPPGPRPLVVCLDEPGVDAQSPAFVQLAQDAGVYVLRAVGGCLAIADTAGPEAYRSALHKLVSSAGAVGALSVQTPAVYLQVAAEVAHAAGLPLILSSPPGATDQDVQTCLAITDQAALPRHRVMLTGAHHVIATTVGPRADAAKLLASWGTVVCFDELGRIPTVQTVVSDHDIGQVILDLENQGAGDRVIVSVGIRRKHQLTAFGGNGFEFITTQFLPYLAAFGASDRLLAGLRRDTAVALFSDLERTAL